MRGWQNVMPDYTKVTEIPILSEETQTTITEQLEIENTINHKVRLRKEDLKSSFTDDEDYKRVISHFDDAGVNVFIDEQKIVNNTGKIIDPLIRYDSQKLMTTRTPPINKKVKKLFPYELARPNAINFQYSIMKDDFHWRKLYTKQPITYYMKNRGYTVFDMIVQIYSIVAQIWNMRKIKVSGRTVLVPTPMRPYRRITVATKLLMKAIRKLRREERYYKDAIVRAMTWELSNLLLFYGPVTTHPEITKTYAWKMKRQNDNELFANLKNIKYGNYI